MARKGKRQRTYTNIRRKAMELLNIVKGGWIEFVHRHIIEEHLSTATIM
jgi:hypothetical protein